MINLTFDRDFIEDYTGIDLSVMSDEDVLLFNNVISEHVKSYLTEFIIEVKPELYDKVY